MPKNDIFYLISICFYSVIIKTRGMVMQHIRCDIIAMPAAWLVSSP